MCRQTTSDIQASVKQQAHDQRPLFIHISRSIAIRYCTRIIHDIEAPRSEYRWNRVISDDCWPWRRYTVCESLSRWLSLLEISPWLIISVVVKQCKFRGFVTASNHLVFCNWTADNANTCSVVTLYRHECLSWWQTNDKIGRFYRSSVISFKLRKKSIHCNCNQEINTEDNLFVAWNKRLYSTVLYSILFYRDAVGGIKCYIGWRRSIKVQC